MTTALAPSTKQLKFARDLYAEYAQRMFAGDRFNSLSEKDQEMMREIHAESTAKLETMDRREISKAIDSMKGIVDRMRINAASKARANAPVIPDLESGIYLASDDCIYKVYRGQSGRMLAKVLVIDVHGDAAHGIDGEAHFDYAGLATRFVNADGKMSLEQAKAYGAIYGVCCVCSATLTDETSIANGIGPVCGRRI